MGLFGSRLREARTIRGLTQEQLAEQADISRVMVGRYETTDQLPAVDTLVRIADALRVSTDYLLSRTDVPDQVPTGHSEQTTRKLKNIGGTPRTALELETLIRQITIDVLIENCLIKNE